MGRRSSAVTEAIAAGLGVAGAMISVVVCAGCVASREPVQETPRRIGGADPGEHVTEAELDELTRAFADRYVGLLYSACDALKKGNPDAQQRREAQQLLLDGATNVYDIASNADSFTRVLDLVVVTRLMSYVWVNDGRAEEVFGDRAAPLVDALTHSRDEAQALAARVLSDEHLAVLESLVLDWREKDRGMTHAAYVRFSNFAIGRGRSAASEVQAAGGFFREVGEAGQAVDEARLLGERVFYRLKREPTLLRWQLEAAKEDMLATSRIASTLDDLERLTDHVEQWPAHVAAEREAIFDSVDSRMERVDTTFAGAEDVIAESRSLVDAIDRASESLGPLLATADDLFARYETWRKWSAATDTPRFDIREYTEMMEETTAAAGSVDEALRSSAELLESPDWDARIKEWSRAMDGRIVTAADQSRLVLDSFLRRLYLVLGALFVALILFHLAAILIVRRIPPAAVKR